MLDGAARLKDLFKEAARMGMPALAMTDHGNVFGAYDFWKQAKEAGVKPIIGMRGLCHAGHAPVRAHPGALGRRRRGRRVRRRRVHAHDDARRDHRGHAQPVPAVVLASLEGYFYKPRVDRELLQRYAHRPHRDDRLPVR